MARTFAFAVVFRVGDLFVALLCSKMPFLVVVVKCIVHCLYDVLYRVLVVVNVVCLL